MSSKKVIVVTGGTRGIGFNLCKYFLEHDCFVVFTGTSDKSVSNAEAELSRLFGKDTFKGVIADVRQYADCQNIINESLDTFKKIDIIICNAGIDICHKDFHQLPIEQINNIVDINLKGAMQCSHAALNYFSNVKGGALYLMEGFGSDGRVQKEMTSYGTSKSAIRYLSKSLANEYKDTNIVIGNLSPGMVATTLLTDSIKELPKSQRKKRIDLYNILADHPETVVEFLGEGILNNTKNNAKIHWLTNAKVMKRFLTAKFNRRKIIDEKDFI